MSKELQRSINAYDQGTFTPVGAQGGGGVRRDPTVENHFPSRILQ